MKFLSALCLTLTLALPAIAQDAREGNVRFKKEDHNGVMADYDASKDQTEDALAARLKAAKLGKKHNESSYWKYEGVNWPEISPDKVDVYFNVERSKGKSVVYMMVSTGYDNFVTTASNPQVVQNMKAFLMKFKDDLTAYNQQVALAAQQKVVDDANHDLKKADRDKERAARREKKANKEKEKAEEQSAEEKKKLDDLKNATH